MAVRAGTLTSTPDVEAQARKDFGFEKMSPELQIAWEATGNIRKPITLKDSEIKNIDESLDLESTEGIL